MPPTCGKDHLLIVLIHSNPPQTRRRFNSHVGGPPTNQILPKSEQKESTIRTNHTDFKPHHLNTLKSSPLESDSHLSSLQPKQTQKHRNFHFLQFSHSDCDLVSKSVSQSNKNVTVLPLPFSTHALEKPKTTTTTTTTWP